ncbi:MAG: hypothetical protein HFJ44_06410 [Clostridia bacterium]|nr:hypothetical protein [Clostridia bacterium]
MFLKLRLKVRNFFKKYKNKIFIVLVIWIIILAINYLLGHQKQKVVLNTTYAPHNVVLLSDSEVPENLQNPIEDLIDDYVNKCNKKDYKAAYELLTEECKTHAFNNSLEKFTKYIDSIFAQEKRYSIQNYSNISEQYIYNLKLLNDIITTGLTNESYAYYEEKIAIKKENGQLKLSVNDYMGSKELKNVAEDDYLKIRIESKEQYYDHEIYTVKATNKSDKTAIIFDGLAGEEIYLVSETDRRALLNADTSLVLIPGETKTAKLTFSKYYDETIPADQIIFNKIRLLTDYTGNEPTEEEQLNKAERVYSINVQVK